MNTKTKWISYCRFTITAMLVLITLSALSLAHLLPYLDDGPSETVFNELIDFLPPSTIAHESLEYEWEPYAEVIVFSADIGLQDLDQWYASKYAVLLRDENDYDPGQITIYFKFDSNGRDVSVCLADTSVDRAIDNLTSYVGSDRLEQLIDTNPRLVGVVFMTELDK